VTEGIRLEGSWRTGQEEDWSLVQRLSGTGKHLDWQLSMRQREREFPWPARGGAAVSRAAFGGQWLAGQLGLRLGDGALFGRGGSFGLAPADAARHASLGFGSASTWRPELWGTGWKSQVAGLRVGLVLSRTPRDLSSDGRGFVLDLDYDDSPSRLARRNAFREDQIAGWLGSDGPRFGWELQGLARRLPEAAAAARTGLAVGLSHRSGAWQQRMSWVRSEHRLVWLQARWQRRLSPRLQLDLWKGRRGQRTDFSELPVAVPRHGSGVGMASVLEVPLRGAWARWTVAGEELRTQERAGPEEERYWEREWGVRAGVRNKAWQWNLALSRISGRARYALQFQKSVAPRVSLSGTLKAAADPGAGARSSFFQIRVEQNRGDVRFHVLLRDQGAARLGQLFFPVPGLPQLESGSGDSDRMGLGLQRKVGVGRHGHGRIAVTLERVIRFREKREGAFTVREPRDRWKMALVWSWFPGKESIRP
jgi:hypothetical protein